MKIMQPYNERGVALVLTLFLMMAISVVGASLMFLSQTETYASMNYRMMSQARYAGEAGIQKAANFLTDKTQYQTPTTGGTDDITSYDRTVSPVLYNGTPVVLSSDSSQSNYPLSTVVDAFAAAAQGTLAADNTNIGYVATARLVAMQQFDSYGGTQNVVQTWEISGTGQLSGARNATVQVDAVVETPKVPASSYGTFGTDNTCGALDFGGNNTINSYDSTFLSGSTVPTLDASGGDVGTNGNLEISGSVQVEGNLYTPRTGVGDCEDGGVVALTETGHADVSGSVVQLPDEVEYPTPDIPDPYNWPDASISALDASTCATQLGISDTTQCWISGGDTLVLDAHGGELHLPSVTMAATLHIVMVAGSPPAQYDFNSLTLVGGATVGVSTTSPTEGVIVNIAGENPDGTTIDTPMDLTGGTYVAPVGCAGCSSFDASIMQFVYGGTGKVLLNGNNNSAVTVYAPNAYVELDGTADLYGSLLGNRIKLAGTGDVHYDRRLQHDFWVAGHPMVSSFSWKRY